MRSWRRMGLKDNDLFWYLVSKQNIKKDDNRKIMSGYQFIAWRSKRKLTQNVPGINPVFSPRRRPFGQVLLFFEPGVVTTQKFKIEWELPVQQNADVYATTECVSQLYRLAWSDF